MGPEFLPMCAIQHSGVVDLKSMQFGALLYFFRSRAGISQAELARSVSLSGAYISTVENSKRRPPPLATVDRLSVALQAATIERELLRTRAAIERAYDFAGREHAEGGAGCLRIEMACR
jgi:transcriptional regulator with XRE-family HTH domain